MGGYNSSMHGGSNGGISVTPLTESGSHEGHPTGSQNPMSCATSGQAGTINDNNNTNRKAGMLPELCLKCVKKQKVIQHLEGDVPKPPISKENSFEDLSTDLLYSKFRFIIVDCRLNTLQ